jgi:uncharacterized membrane protein YagU involved in acid resistance
MQERLNQLSFVIGLFFILVSIVLVVGYFLVEQLSHNINLYTGIGVGIFGIFMVRLKA